MDVGLQNIYRTRNADVLPGMDVQAGLKDDELFVNDHPRAAKVVTVTVDTASQTDYTVTILGVDITVDSGDLPSSPNKTDVRDELISHINDEPLVNGTVLAEANNSDDFTITARQGGQDFSFSQSDSNLSDTTSTSNADAALVEFGRAVIFDGFGGSSAGGEDQTPLARKPDAADLTARDLQLTLSGFTASDTVTVTLDVAGSTIYASDTGAGDLDTLLQNLRDDINNNADLVVASVDTSPSPSELHIKPETAGFADFEVTGAKPPEGEEWTLTTVAEGDDINDLLAGVALREPDADEADHESDPALAGYPGGANMSVRTYGKVPVETEDDVDLSNNPDGEVYVRLSANGDLDKLGGFRTDFNSGAVPLKAARFVGELDSDADVLKVTR